MYNVFVIRFDHDNAEVVRMSDNIVYQTSGIAPMVSHYNPSYDTLHIYEELPDTANDENQEESNNTFIDTFCDMIYM